MIKIYSTNWCGPCKLINEEVHDWFKKMPDTVKCYDLDVDVPTAPGSITLVDPEGSPSSDLTPKFRIDNLIAWLIFSSNKAFVSSRGV